MASSSAPSSNSPQGKTRSSRAQQTPPCRRPLYYRPLFWVVLLLGALGAGSVSRGYRVWRTTEAQIPPIAKLLAYERGGTITIQADNGTVLQKIGPATRDKLAYEEIPRLLVEAFIAAEDQRFYEHTGVDFQAIIRATLANARQREVVEGASTITQQLARIVFLDQERSFRRKAREALLALKINEAYDKSVILERYLNLVYLGAGAYGVADAAWIYFGKTVDELTLSEAALIAGMAPAPSAYSPLVAPEAARQQRDIVIRRMLENGTITQAEARSAIAAEIATTPKERKFLYSEFPYFTIYVQKRLGEILPPEVIEAGGLVVETTLNIDWQRKAEATIDETVDTFGRWERFGQASLVAIDPRSGEVKAVVGGTDFGASQFNRATQAHRQPGSTFKTFVYTAAIAAGFSPDKSYTDAKFVVDGYQPKNYGGQYSGNVTMRKALTSSINIVAVKVLIDVGFDPIIQMAKRMGIGSELQPTYSLALGASEVTLLELTGAYGTLATQGKHFPTHSIRRVLNSSGEVLYEADTMPQQAVDPTTAAIMTWMLRGVVEGGTGSQANIGRPVAGKTGTSEKSRDLWFVGYIPQLVVGIWLGNDDSSRTWGASSSAAYTWRQFVSQLLEGIPVEEFPPLPTLAGRKGSIKADPVKPGRTRASQTANAGSDRQNTQNSAETAASSSSTTANPAPDTVENSAVTPASSNRSSSRSPAPIPPEPAPVVDSAPVPAPVPDNSGPAPVPEPAPIPEPAPVPEAAPIPEPPVPEPVVPVPEPQAAPAAPAPAPAPAPIPVGTDEE